MSKDSFICFLSKYLLRTYSEPDTDVQIHRKATRMWPRPARTKHAIKIDGKVVLVIAAGLGEGPGPEQAMLNAWEGATGLGVTSARNSRPAFVSAPNDRPWLTLG